MENSKLGVFWNVRFTRAMRSSSLFAGMSVVNER